MSEQAGAPESEKNPIEHQPRRLGKAALILFVSVMIVAVVAMYGLLAWGAYRLVKLLVHLA